MGDSLYFLQDWLPAEWGPCSNIISRNHALPSQKNLFPQKFILNTSDDSSAAEAHQHAVRPSPKPEKATSKTPSNLLRLLELLLGPDVGSVAAPGKDMSILGI